MNRPIIFNDFIGHEKNINNLKVSIDASVKKNKQIEHILIYGQPGTGKTTLATIIANSIGSRIRHVQGGSLLKNTDIINILFSLNEKDVLFIDEIHSMSLQCAEILYIAMEDFVIDIVFGKEFNKKISRIKLPSFTLIGATTNIGKLTLPLEERFGILINLNEYKIEWIEKIIKNVSIENNIQLSDSEITLIAQNSKNIPRNALRILNRVADYKLKYDKIETFEILKLIGIYKNGLDENDIKYLNLLNNSSFPLGIKTISQILHIEQETIENRIEYFLLNHNFINKTGKGRIISNEGKKYLSEIITNNFINTKL